MRSAAEEDRALVPVSPRDSAISLVNYIQVRLARRQRRVTRRDALAWLRASPAGSCTSVSFKVAACCSRALARPAGVLAQPGPGVAFAIASHVMPWPGCHNSMAPRQTHVFAVDHCHWHWKPAWACVGTNHAAGPGARPCMAQPRSLGDGWPHWQAFRRSWSRTPGLLPGSVRKSDFSPFLSVIRKLRPISTVNVNTPLKNRTCPRGTKPRRSHRA